MHVCWQLLQIGPHVASDQANTRWQFERPAEITQPALNCYAAGTVTLTAHMYTIRKNDTYLKENTCSIYSEFVPQTQAVKDGVQCSLRLSWLLIPP